MGGYTNWSASTFTLNTSFVYLWPSQVSKRPLSACAKLVFDASFNDPTKLPLLLRGCGCWCGETGWIGAPRQAIELAVILLGEGDLEAAACPRRQDVDVHPTGVIQSRIPLQLPGDVCRRRRPRKHDSVRAGGHPA